MFNLFKDNFRPSGFSDKIAISESAIAIRSLLKGLIEEKYSAPLSLYILDSGSCNGCEMELELLFSPLYDLSSFSVEVTYDASKADILIITGLMTENMYIELGLVYEKMKKPKSVIMLGDCPIFSVPFKDTFALKDKVHKFFPNAFHISGCPPEPLVLLEGLHESLKNK